eukprot:CAMPEP_0198283310 /NCGR_PEP_ID=MMETSP1449-20131203/2951_1 /TAXON_ID=420275 /ORGANISM="Attheya septentrionalis, Strain CCMP2084" /LENGTH=97 /DNA_ID=CAMNT_0043979891 /DNA_START=447 /DNA_END=740 /DNA_ORIENTATION=-
MRKLAPDQLKAMLIRKREERKVRLSELIEERSQEIDDHASGRRLLNDEDHSRVLKQHKNFNWKLDQMENEDPETREFNLNHEVEHFNRMHEIPGLDF